MDWHKTTLLGILVMCLCACNQRIYSTNGETIYKTGKNMLGERMLDKKASRIRIASSCKTCHGKNGNAMKHVSVKFRDLSDTANFAIPYTDSLFFRFLDQDLKASGTAANIGVIWKMSDKDKRDLLEYLKSL